MEPAHAQRLARDLMDAHGLSTWTFRFDRGLRRFGACFPRDARIQLSRRLVEVNGEAQVRDTILHEIAHAWAFLRHGDGVAHDARWKAIARELGCDPKARWAHGAVQAPPLRWLAVCPNGHASERARRWTGRRPPSCAKCRPFYDPRFALSLVPNPEFTGP